MEPMPMVQRKFVVARIVEDTNATNQETIAHKSNNAREMGKQSYQHVMDDVDDSTVNDLALNVDHIFDAMNVMHSTLIVGGGFPFTDHVHGKASHMKIQSSMKPGPHTTRNNPLDGTRFHDTFCRPYGCVS
ncbi:hypothetical protein Tco_0687734 [Tanacetum coccineum]